MEAYNSFTEGLSKRGTELAETAIVPTTSHKEITPDASRVALCHNTPSVSLIRRTYTPLSLPKPAGAGLGRDADDEIIADGGQAHVTGAVV